MWTDDPVADYEAYDRQRAAELDKLPKCSECEEPIQDERFYLVEGKKYCKSCMEDFKEWTDDYIE